MSVLLWIAASALVVGLGFYLTFGQRTKMSALLWLPGIALVIGSAFFSLGRISDHFGASKPQMIDKRIANLAAQLNQTSFQWPGGEMHRLVIATPSGQEGTSYRGKLELRIGSKLIYSTPVSYDSSRTCNWLYDEGLEGRIPDMEAWRVLSTISPEENCQVTVTLDEEPNDCSLWISYASKRSDRKSR